VGLPRGLFTDGKFNKMRTVASTEKIPIPKFQIPIFFKFGTWNLVLGIFQSIATANKL